MGATHMRPAEATKADLKQALQAAWKCRIERNSKAKASKIARKPR
jgi:hypothetical protein